MLERPINKSFPTTLQHNTEVDLTRPQMLISTDVTETVKLLESLLKHMACHRATFNWQQKVFSNV